MKRIAIISTLALAPLAAHAQDFPTKALTITVPNPPGGMNQVHAQPLSVVLERLTGQPAPVVNRPGAVGAAGTAFVVNQPPDGHNLLVTTANLHLAVEKDKLYGAKTPYSLEQIAFVALMSSDPLIMGVHPVLPAKTVKDLIALAKAKPNELVFSTSGPYGITHTPIVMFMDATKTRMRHLPTTGGGPAITQALGGHSQVTGGGPATMAPHGKTGKLRLIASWGTQPHPAVPDAPTFKSMGIDIEAYLWVGLFTSAAVPEATQTRLRDLARRAINDAQFQKALEGSQVVLNYRDAPEFRKFFEADHKRMASAIKSIGKI
ncbi:MAG: tripartite tricarboxylate transporter substrate binding protein [Betaproteobacteria bacterium]|nr:tripartite tricarboxylate transporter substrate binding protein [Betaproteobacteria bacterium]